MVTLITVIHVIVCIFLVLAVLLQAGKGAEISASFSGSSQTIFGTSGGANFFTRFTAILFAIFLLTSTSLTLIKNRKRESIFESGSIPQAQTPVNQAPTGQAPAAPQAAKPDTAAPAKTESASGSTNHTEGAKIPPTTPQ